MSNPKARIWELVEAAAHAVTDDNGRFNDTSFQKEVQVRLKAEQQPRVRDEIERDAIVALTTRFVNRRKPKPKPDALFNPECILRLGNGERVWMDNATDKDTVAWMASVSKNVARVTAAAAVVQSYGAERLNAFAEHPEWTLGQVERKIFGWVETATEEDPVEDGSEDDGLDYDGSDDDDDDD